MTAPTGDLHVRLAGALTAYADLDSELADECAAVLVPVVQDCGHHSWAGLMALLDEHWPADLFPTRYPDDPARDAGARIVSLLRWIDRLRRTEADTEYAREAAYGIDILRAQLAHATATVARVRRLLATTPNLDTPIDPHALADALLH